MTLPAEAALAGHIAKRHEFLPGNDLSKLVEIYADIDHLQFPVETVDGISLHLKAPGRRPNIIINSSIPKTRAKFTLAHEFGHVLIPWHFGTIFSNITKYSSSVNSAYREMEAEANRFAAELLMPRDWLGSLYDQLGNPAEMVRTVQKTCGTSPSAALISVNNSLPPGFVYVRTNHSGHAVESCTSAGTVVAPFSNGEHFEKSLRFEECAKFYTCTVKGFNHSWLYFESEQQLDNVVEARSWRELLDAIISEADPDNSQPNIKGSLNGIISTCNKPDITPEKFFATVRQKLSGRDELRQRILAHPLFNAFLIKRIEEFMARRNESNRCP